MSYEDVLQNILSNFPSITHVKEEQSHCIKSLLDGKDVFGVLPTGFGKSLIYQLFIAIKKDLHKDAVVKPSILVVSPLKSIVQDQIQELNESFLSALDISSCWSDDNAGKV